MIRQTSGRSAGTHDLSVRAGDILAEKYEVERVLGAGGMGVVVAARHIHLGERVAIKFLLPEALVRPEVVSRFLREGRAAAKLRSEHAARVFDVGMMNGNQPYLVMEYLEGKDLGAIFRAKGKMPIETVVGYVLQACEALAEAHGLGIVHRDLKPANLFLTTRPDGSPQIKIIDFGISKMVDESTDGEMTATAVMMGSPLYMAPEQMASARDVDARSDVWSMGVILFTLITGGVPFKAPSAMEIFELILKGPPSARTGDPDVPEELDAAISKCLRRDRDARFTSISQLALAIAPFASPEAQLSAMRIKRMSRPSVPPPGPATDAAGPVSAPISAPISTAPGVSLPVPPARDVTPERTVVWDAEPNKLSDPAATAGTWGKHACSSASP